MTYEYESPPVNEKTKLAIIASIGKRPDECSLATYNSMCEHVVALEIKVCINQALRRRNELDIHSDRMMFVTCCQFVLYSTTTQLIQGRILKDCDITSFLCDTSYLL